VALWLVAATGVAVALSSVLFGLTGPFAWYGRWVGVYLVHEVTLAGAPTGITLLRIAGPFLAPGGAALVLAPAILAALAMRSMLGRRGRLLSSLSVAVMLAALVLTFSRVGWAAVIAGSALLAVARFSSGRSDRASVVVCLIMTLAFVGLWMNAFGLDYRPDLTASRIEGSPAVIVSGTEGNDLPQIPEAVGPAGGTDEPARNVARGGSELSGRLEIWTASVRAIAGSPWVGYGPGTNALALDPFLHGESRRFVGLTSHNTWLRTWVEDGVFALIGLLGVTVVALDAGLRPIVVRKRQSWQRLGLVAIVFGLLVAQAFETFLLGGVTLPSFIWALAAGILVAGMPNRRQASPGRTA
jgi:hypothetical protein